MASAPLELERPNSCPGESEAGLHEPFKDLTPLRRQLFRRGVLVLLAAYVAVVFHCRLE